MQRLAPRAVLALLSGVVAALAAPPAAPSQTGTITGAATELETGAPVPFSLVRLLSGDEAVRGIVTDSAGRFRFESLPAGEYRLRLDRIGFAPVSSPVLRLAPGEALRHDLRARMAPIELAGVVVRAGDTCFPFDRLGEAPDLEALWREARKGAETRRQFELQYRYSFRRQHEGLIRLRIGRDQRVLRDTVIVHEPDSVLVREARRREEGYGTQGATSITLALPNEAELLSEEFMTDHCLEGAVEERDGAWGLRFRPVRARGDRIDIRGVVWLDSATFQVRALEFEHLDGRSRIAHSTVRYGAVPIPGGSIRLPREIAFSGRLTGAGRLLVSGYEMFYVIPEYFGFERVAGSSPGAQEE